MSHHGEQIAEFVEVDSGKRSDRLQLAAAMALANRRALAGAKARGIELGNPKQAETKRAKAAEQAQALRPHIERWIDAGRMSGSAIAADLNARGIAAPNGGEWLPKQVRRVRDGLGLLSRPGSFTGRDQVRTRLGLPRAQRFGRKLTL